MPSRRDFLKGAFAGTASIALPWAAWAQGGGRRPNVLYLLTDQWRASATGYAGDANVKTPHLDRLAAESVNFRNAVSVCPVCTPHRAALLTGRYPTSTGMFLNDLFLPDEAACLGEIYKAAGYDTGYIGKWHLDGHGRASLVPPERRQGFVYWKAAECDHNYTHSHYYAGDAPEKRYWQGYDAFDQTRDAQEYLRGRATTDKPFVLVVSYGPPHTPHDQAPKEYRDLYPAAALRLPPNVPEAMVAGAQKEASGYYAHCTALDQCVGDLLRCLDETGLAKDTLLVFTSDHGEEMGSHGQAPGEKQRPWDESIRVPFLLRLPGARKGREMRAPINTPDILPTLLGLCGVPIPRSVEGEDLSRLVRGEQPERERAALVMSVSPFAGYHSGLAFRGVRTSRYTYVRSVPGPWLLFDNERDPYQMNNLAKQPAYRQLQEEMDAVLQASLHRIGDPFRRRDAYLQHWGYEVDGKGCIPYGAKQKTQGPHWRARPGGAG